MPKKITVRFNKEEETDKLMAREVLGIPKGVYGEDAQIIKKSIKFVVNFHHLIWSKFLNDYTPSMREYIKKELNS